MVNRFCSTAHTGRSVRIFHARIARPLGWDGPHAHGTAAAVPDPLPKLDTLPALRLSLPDRRRLADGEHRRSRAEGRAWPPPGITRTALLAPWQTPGTPEVPPYPTISPTHSRRARCWWSVCWRAAPTCSARCVHWTGRPLVRKSGCLRSRSGRPGAYARALSRSRSTGRLEDCPSEPAECGGTARGADAAPSPQHTAVRPGGCRAGRAGGSPCLGQAIWSPQDRPILRVRTMSSCAPSGQVLLAVLRQTSRPRQGCAGVGSVFKHAPMRMAGTPAVTWGGGDDEAECYSSSVSPCRWMRRRIPSAGGTRRATATGHRRAGTGNAVKWRTR